MQKSFIIEIKYRIILVTINLIFFINIFYFYKEIIFFIFFKNTIDLYLICSSYYELFNVYMNIIKILSTNLIFYFIIYHFLMFNGTAFYKKEYKFTFVVFYLFLFFQIYIIFYSINSFYLFIKFLKTYKESYIYYEIKANELFLFFFIYYKFLKIIHYFSLITISFNFHNYQKLRKIFYFLIIFYFLKIPIILIFI